MKKQPRKSDAEDVAGTMAKGCLQWLGMALLAYIVLQVVGTLAVLCLLKHYSY